MVGKYGTFICCIFIENMKYSYPYKSITYYVMFGGASNLQLGGDFLKIHYPKLTVMHGAEQ